MNADQHLVKQLLAEIRRVEDQGGNDALMILLGEWFNSGETDPRYHAALGVARSQIEAANQRQALIGSVHHLVYLLPNGGRVRAALRIDALDGDECRHTLVFVSPPDPLAMAAGPIVSEAFITDAVRADLRAIVIGRREPATTPEA